jgi:hypothetical protein
MENQFIYLPSNPTFIASAERVKHQMFMHLLTRHELPRFSSANSTCQLEGQIGLLSAAQP